MELKTKIAAEENRQELVITREFDLPVNLLFRAYAEPELFEQWMGTKVVKYESRKHGSYQFETSGPQGHVLFRANGVFHEFETDRKITRTFEMMETQFDVQLEFLEFESLSADTSKLTMHVIYRSAALRDELLKLPFAQGINMAHNRLEEIVTNLK